MIEHEFLEPTGDPIDEELNKPVDVAEERAQREDKARKYLEIRSFAYKRVFEGKGSPFDVLVVMNDLTRFCRADATPWAADARVHALLTGRFETFRRIEDFRTLSLDQLVEKYINGRRPSEIE